jgi:Pectate lyase superfamily protein
MAIGPTRSFGTSKTMARTVDLPHQLCQCIFPTNILHSGDGIHDDTAAINAAISAGGRCVPRQCQSSTISPAVVYFPAGTYMLSYFIIDYYYTQLIGNPHDKAVLKGMPGFQGPGLIDADPYQSSGNQAYESTNVFFVSAFSIHI